MSAMAASMDEYERLRLLAIMGVDVYVPRDTPLARVSQPGATQARDTPSPSENQALATPVGARLIIGGIRRDEHPRFLASVLRAARLRSGDWTFDASASPRLPEWRFGSSAAGEETLPAMTFPDLAELRDSVVARRCTWHQLRAWLRGP